MGFCSSLFARRVAEVEEHLTDNLLPRTPYRQYVLTFPYNLCYRLAWDSGLLDAIHKTVIDRIYRFIRDQLSIKFKRKGLRPGSVSFIQGCGALLNLNMHFHVLVLDGFCLFHENKKPFFIITEAVELCLDKRGLLENEESTEIDEELLSIEAASCASVGQRIAFGEHRGQRVRRLGFRRDGDSIEFKAPRCMALSGFGLHAARVVDREDRRGLSHLINYMARPPIAEARLPRNDAGDIECGLKDPWGDGTTGITLIPSELIEKLIALIPPRSSPLVHYGGVFAPNFKGRDKVILCPGKRKRRVSVAAGVCGGTSKKVKVGGGSWARLLRRVFVLDVSKCPRCGAGLELISAVLDVEQIYDI